MKEDFFIRVLRELKQESKCVSRQVAALIVREGRIISTGYNGTLKRAPNCCELHRKDSFDRETHHQWSLANEIHAEQNAILYAVRNKTTVEGATLYVTLSPCLSCARIIFTMGISRVIFFNSYAEHKGLTNDEGVDFLRKFGVQCEKYAGQLANVTHMI